MADDRASQDTAEREARNAVTLGLSDQKTMQQLSSSGKSAQDRRRQAARRRAQNESVDSQAATQGDTGQSRSQSQA
ncbi:uncharacterized protein AKAW2_21170S [Aspergillus luchuensis]|uniref:Short chain dehydrogenase/reductase family oxidoreductase n=1 Tax=Aspergillus kawachii TaxID=1069201 RepID=A0A146FKW2_ASPKA|nr:uncharacterized protein AKAW2_21170S [Aspergillus luchuensis]BCR96229.1 hypothetical protein AKAW2_21170S [Aspergillus luchuensis]GAT26714.1 short chain dehydrogenase/reductase family oxidoreductase [Aspergillus luchuensis]